MINVNAKMVDKRVQFWCSLLNAHYIPSVFIPSSHFTCVIALILYGMSDVLGRMYFPTYGSSCVVWIYEWTIHPMGTETAISISEVCKMKDSEERFSLKLCISFHVTWLFWMMQYIVEINSYRLKAGKSWTLRNISA